MTKVIDIPGVAITFVIIVTKRPIFCHSIKKATKCLSERVQIRNEDDEKVCKVRRLQERLQEFVTNPNDVSVEALVIELHDEMSGLSRIQRNSILSSCSHRASCGVSFTAQC